MIEKEKIKQLPFNYKCYICKNEVRYVFGNYGMEECACSLKCSTYFPLLNTLSLSLKFNNKKFIIDIDFSNQLCYLIDPSTYKKILTLDIDTDIILKLNNKDEFDKILEKCRNYINFS